LFTGLDMAAHGVWTDGVTLPAHETIVSERFAENGYESWLFGRRHLAGVANWATEHTRAGEYNHVAWAHGPLHRSRQNAYLNWLQANEELLFDEIFPTQANPDSTDIPPQQRTAMAKIPDELSFNTWIGSTLAERIKSHSTDTPFFAVAGFVVGESMGAEPDKNRVTESLNPNALHQADDAVGNVLQTLKHENLGKNTIVIVASARGSAGEIKDTKAKAIDLHEQAIKVPLFISATNQTPQVVDLAVSTMDLAPTLYELSGIKAPERIQGRSLLSNDRRGWSLSRLRHPAHPHQTTLCDERFKLVLTHGQLSRVDTETSANYCLYDLQEDPDQQHNLASIESYQNQLEVMIDQLIDARVALEDRTEPRIASF